jgi:hypothetical protein
VRDTSEVEATKNAGRFKLPVFVILPGPTHALTGRATTGRWTR